MHRKALSMAVSSLLIEVGFDSAEHVALETLTEILQSFIAETGSSARSYCELAGRTEPLFADVILALVNGGFNVSGIEEHARRPNKNVIPAPLASAQPKQLSILQAGTKRPHPSHIPAHLPVFPDPHAYIRTPTHKQPVTEYEAIREKSAQQKRDIERALNKFEAKTSETDSLFLSQDSIFPLIAAKPQFPPYLVALLPKDQVFDFEYDDAFRSPHRKKAGKEVAGNGTVGLAGVLGTAGGTTSSLIKEEEEEAVRSDADLIDNPYLRPVKLPPPKIKLKDLLPQATS